MRRTILAAGILPFISAFLGGVLAFSLVVPRLAEAQQAGIRTEQVIATEVLFLVGRNGLPRASLGTTPEGATGLSIYGQDGEVRTRLVVDEHGGRLRFGSDTQPVLTIGELGNDVAGLLLRDYSDNFAALLQATPDGRALLVLPHIVLEGDLDSATHDPAVVQLRLFDRDFMERISLGLESDGTPTLRLRDQSGEPIWSAP